MSSKQDPSDDKPGDGGKALADWGKRVLRPARERLNLTRDQVATMSGVAWSTIRNIEAGKHKPRADILDRLCKPLGLLNPLATSNALTVEIGELPADRALDLFAAGLAALVRSWASLPDGRPNDVDGVLENIECAQEAHDAAALLTAINAQRKPRR